MHSKTIEKELINYTITHSHYDTHRNYLGMSQILLDEAEILRKFTSHTPATIDQQLKCYKGYQMEEDLVKRCKQIWANRISHRELSAYNGLVKGNPDLFLDDYPCDCKSVLLDEHLPKDNRLPKKVYWQMQAYMLYSKKSMGFVIYESRESGKLAVFVVQQNRHIQTEIEMKFESLVQKVKLLINK